jgi:hypothetical protein
VVASRFDFMLLDAKRKQWRLSERMARSRRRDRIPRSNTVRAVWDPANVAQLTIPYFNILPAYHRENSNPLL